jgi:hypothetical protein
MLPEIYVDDGDPFGERRGYLIRLRGILARKIDAYEDRLRGLPKLPPGRREIERRYLHAYGDHLKEQAEILERWCKRAGIKGGSRR